MSVEVYPEVKPDFFMFLDDDQKETLKTFCKGYTIDEVAELSGMHRNTVAKRLRHAYELVMGLDDWDNGTYRYEKLRLFCIKHGLVKPEEIEL